MRVEDAACPACGAAPGALSITQRLVARPLGTWSLAGGQLKVSAQLRYVLACATCDLEAVGTPVSEPEPGV